MPLAGPGAKLSIKTETPREVPSIRPGRRRRLQKTAGPIALLKGEPMTKGLMRLWKDDSGQDIAEYAVMLAVILVIVVGTIRLVGSNANKVFSDTTSALQ